MMDVAESLGLDWQSCLDAGSIYGEHNPGPEGLDSLSSVALAVELEDHFDYQFEPMAFVGINSPTGLEELVRHMIEKQ
jgi:hypothetical protein